jgi:hypothetical protein
METGHHKNAAHYAQLIQFCIGFGPQYDPALAALLTANMTTQHTAVTDAIAAVNTRKPPFLNAVNARIEAFQGFMPFVTKVINAFAASGAPQLAIADARTLVRKIRGNRGPKPKDNPDTPQDESLNFISASQRSYDSHIEHFHQLTLIIAAQPAYAPNEADLTNAALATYLTSLRTVNAAVVTATVPYSNAIIARDTLLYHPTTGLVNTSKLCKNYVKSVFGAQSQQYALIKGIEFRTLARVLA